jgi:LEA14-like dessication related protein
MNARHRIIVSCLAAALLASCGGIPKLEAPRATVNSVSVDRINGLEARFSVTLDLTNPNDRDIAVDAIDATVMIEDVPIGTAALAAPVRLPARGEASAILQARAGFDAITRIAAQLAQRTQEQRATGGATLVRYTVAGTATLEGGLTVPFSRSGDFRLGGRNGDGK